MEDLQTRISELSKTVTDMQVESANQEFILTVRDNAELKDILRLIDKNYTWNSKNAALTVHVHDTLKQASNSSDVTVTEGGIEIPLKATIMTGLYNILLNIENTGVEAARKITRILTSVGKDVSEAMQVVAQDNEEIQKLHVELQQLEQQLIEAEENETSEQIQEEA
jgi:hypothetical protein